MSQKQTTTVASIQTYFTEDTKDNVMRLSALIEQAAQKGAQVICLPELFESVYFCTFERDEFFNLAQPILQNESLKALQKLAAKLKLVLPVSLFERDGQCFYNSVAMVGSDGEIMGVYRKSHIPDGPGYEEKYYFRPGDTGFRVWSTEYGRIGVGICWDQWFPEAARAMMLMGADILMYPTAIGTEPEEPNLDTKDPWQRAMIGHAVSNVVPVVAANRIGKEMQQTFYGHSFICDHRGNKVQELGRDESGVLLHSFDLSAISINRAAFGFFRDRRSDLYATLVK